MIAKDTIYIKNIYHMLSYAFRIPDNVRYNKIQSESFENIDDLLSGILILGVSEQIKKGLIRDYKDFSENTSSIKGKINITESINSLSFLKKQLNCTYDEFSINCYLNQIIKTTMDILFKSKVKPKRKKELKKLLMYFSEVDLLDVHSIDWKIRFDRNNQTYKMLINISYLAIKRFIQTENEGNLKLMEFEFEDRPLERLYEKFILNYYIEEHRNLKPRASKIHWQVQEGADEFLPEMRTDATLMNENKILIIDAKFYGQNISENHTHHIDNMYQIFAYVKNKQEEVKGKGIEVSGMLLYAKTSDSIQPDSEYMMSGNRISVQTLDLNQEFSVIKEQLERIVQDYL